MTDFLQLTVSGISLGLQYALVALGFVVILKASGVLSIFQGGMVLAGAYLAYQAHQVWGWGFILSVGFAIVACMFINVAVESQVLRRVKDRSHLIPIMVTFGLLLGLAALVAAIWGTEQLHLGDPWGLDRLDLWGVSITTRDVWVIGVSLVVLAGVFYLFERTKIGLAMRAAASDPEAATAQGISPRVAQGVSWAVAGGLAALAGVLLATAVGGGVRPGLSDVAFAALPALFLGGMGSPIGAVVGGIALGLAQQWAAGYAPESFGQGFSVAFPYLVMILVLLIRPQGIFGEKTVSRA